ncbi:unnamed protein product, partial [Staurois parvus]
CPIIGISGRNSFIGVSGRNSSLVSVGGIVPRQKVPRHWCQWGDNIIGISGRNSASSLVSVGGKSSVSVGGGIVPHHRCQWGE